MTSSSQLETQGGAELRGTPTGTARHADEREGYLSRLMGGAQRAMGSAERAAWLGAGGALLLAVGRPTTLAGAAAAATGGALLYRGVRGRWPLAGALTTSGSPLVRRSITIGASPGQVYEFCRDITNMAHIMGDTADVTQADGLAHWRVKGPLHRRWEWDMELVEDRRGEALGWESRGEGVLSSLQLQFSPAPGDRGTEVILELELAPPFGAAGRTAFEMLRAVPTVATLHALRRCKSLIETGEAPTTKHQPAARRH